jgi:hypothetical protein
MAAAATRLMPAVIKFWADVLAAEEMKEIQKHSRKIMVPKYTTLDRFRASENLMAYVFGKPPQAIEGNFTEAKKQILEVRWLPPDRGRIRNGVLTQSYDLFIKCGFVFPAVEQTKWRTRSRGPSDKMRV